MNEKKSLQNDANFEASICVTASRHHKVSYNLHDTAESHRGLITTAVSITQMLDLNITRAACVTSKEKFTPNNGCVQEDVLVLANDTRRWLDSVIL